MLGANEAVRTAPSTFAADLRLRRGGDGPWIDGSAPTMWVEKISESQTRHDRGKETT